MSKLIIFLASLLCCAIVLTFFSYQELPKAPQVRFDMKKLEAIHHAEEKMHTALQHHEEDPMNVKEEAGAVDLVKKIVEIPLDSEELKRGHEIYRKTGKCVTCHGQNGEGLKSQQAPKLAGQYDWYLTSQLISMKAGVRVNKKMEPYLKNLTEKDMQDVSLFLSKLPVQ